ncbi:Unknown protein [Striga hermonthica]|uniref:Uncharacterized protein n=1 Tax=Striga hermonthica TaxID=68872 RepID=A0A9N7NWC1_STRHE|nr:Unknown protein [Striga hermonthica]
MRVKVFRNFDPNLRTQEKVVAYSSVVVLQKKLSRGPPKFTVGPLPSPRPLVLYGDCNLRVGLLTQSEGSVNDDEAEYFRFIVYTRVRLELPLPALYFRNCMELVVVEIKHGMLRCGDGFFTAGKMIGEFIANKVNKEELLKDAYEWLVKHWPLIDKRAFGVSGSLRFDLYGGVDFGLGKPSKYDVVSTDKDRSMSLCKSMDFKGVC